MFYSMTSQWHTVVIIKMKSKVLCDSQKCINLFTAALYSKSQVCQPFLIITYSQDKGKNSVFTFINALTDYIQFEKGDMLIIYTDGPSSELKNRYIVKLVIKKIPVQSFLEIFCMEKVLLMELVAQPNL